MLLVLQKQLALKNVKQTLPPLRKIKLGNPRKSAAAAPAQAAAPTAALAVLIKQYNINNI